MNCIKVGKLIYSLRKEKNLTQKQVATALNISDKTISKWERSLGCPDISLLGQLSQIFGVNIESILSGDLEPNPINEGNMKRIKFYFCPNCGNVINSAQDAEVSCCGRKIPALTAKPADETHRAQIEEIEDEHYITFSHEMSKTHYISFIAYINMGGFLFIKLYPEQSPEIRVPRMRGGKLLFYCNQHGLFEQK